MTRPNVLWIFPDELRADSLGCYGGSYAPVATPNIDRLAETGVLFRNHFCNSPACVPSRASILTASHPVENGIHSNEGAWASFPLPVRLDTFPEHFARRGYRTASIGKSHAPTGYRPWQEERGEGGGMHIFGLDRNPVRLEPIVPIGIPSPVGGVFPDDEPFPPERVTVNALDWLAAAPEEPFLLRVAYLQPHTPVLPPARYRQLYRAEDWPGHDLPRGYGSRYEEAFAEMVGGRALTHHEMQRAQADYHALVTWLDVQVGLLMAMLKLRGLAERTIVVFDSDHGASLGENGLLSKVVFAPQSHRTPRIVAWPGTLAPAERDDIAQNLDLARTLCDLCGIAPAPGFRGRALFSDPAPEAIFATIGNGAPDSRASSAANKGTWPNGSGWPRRGCVRTARFRLDMNVRLDGGSVPEAEKDVYLADWRTDPRETVNLASGPAQAAVGEALKAQLAAHVAGSVEPAFIPAFSEAEAPEFLPPKIGAAA